MIQQIKKNSPFVILENGEKIDLPPTIKRRFSAYHYKQENGNLYISCYKCKREFAVARLTEECTWQDIHIEKEYRYLPSNGFGSYCASCESRFNGTKETATLSKKGKSYELYHENQRYLGHRGIEEGCSITYLLNKIIEKERRENPLSKIL